VYLQPNTLSADVHPLQLIQSSRLYHPRGLQRGAIYRTTLDKPMACGTFFKHPEMEMEEGLRPCTEVSLRPSPNEEEPTQGNGYGRDADLLIATRGRTRFQQPFNLQALLCHDFALHNDGQNYWTNYTMVLPCGR
jgi:hypothetical protein